MTFIYLGVVLYIVLYLYQILSGLRKIKMTHELIDIFNNALKAKNLFERKKLLVPQMPKLKYLNPSYPADALSYEKDDYDFNQAVKIIYSHLFTILDYLLFEKWRIFNPLTPLKDIFLIPSKTLSFLGLNLNSIVSNLFSAVTWLVIYHEKFSSFITTLKPVIEQFFQNN